ncbi:hypothetical protein GCM10009804_11420 [Kribbella hippodromi]|uniref:HSP18 transcriptional regulator n=1 Tax=Kribbella hippodromi TaxID=434347 RepID=A0ABP4N669_9ACTN
MAAADVPEDLPKADQPASVSAVFAAVEETVRQLTPPVPADADPAQDSSGNDSSGNDSSAQDGSMEAGSSDLLAALAGLRLVQERLAAWEPLLIGAARTHGASWAAIAPALGLASRQAAERRYLRLNSHATDPEGMTGEQRVQAARNRRAGDRAVNQWARANAAMLRQLAARITALDGLDRASQQTVDRVLLALGDNDSAKLLSPLSAAGAELEDTHPALAGEVADINTTTDQLRTGNTARTP